MTRRDENEPMTDVEISTEALRILQILTSIPFDECYLVTKDLAELPTRLCIYAVRHREEGILYISKAGSVRTRFSGGHKALLWEYLERLDPDDVIAALPLSYEWRRHQLELETVMLQTAKPRYNSRIRSKE